MFDSFDGAVVHIFEVDFPIFWNCFFVYGKAVVLGGDVTTLVFEIHTRLIL